MCLCYHYFYGYVWWVRGLCGFCVVCCSDCMVLLVWFIVFGAYGAGRRVVRGRCPMWLAGGAGVGGEG